MSFAIDPGYATTGVAIGDKSVVIPSVVGIGSADVGLLSVGADDKQSARPDRIEFGGHKYLAGRNVGAYTAPVQSMDLSRLEASDELCALLYAALSKVLGPGAHELRDPIIGFPVSVLRDKKVGKRVISALGKWLIGGHGFTRNGRYVNLRITGKILALPQPVGTLYDWSLDDSGAPTVDAEALAGLIGILDIGKNTLDALAVENGAINPRYTGGAPLGTRTATEVLMRALPGLDEPAADKLLRTKGNPTWAGKDIYRLCEMATAQAASRIAAYVERLWEGMHAFSLILVTGGGSLMLRHELESRLPPGAVFVKEPVKANVLGLAKYGKLLEVQNDR